MRILPGLLLYVGLIPANADVLRPVDSDDVAGASAAVVIDDVPLAHTAQFLPFDVKGEIVGAGDAALQVGKIVEDLGVALGQAKSGLDRLVKLNVCVAKVEAVDGVRKALAERLRGKARPATAYVVAPLPRPEALVAMDAVAAADPTAGGETVNRLSCAVYGVPGFPQVAVLPAGGRVYISGQAEKGKDLAESTRLTLEGLRRTLTWLGLKDSGVVQLKAFGQVAADRPAVEAEIAKVFPVPLVFVEGDAGNPVEIEIVAAAGNAGHPAAESVTYLTPPWMIPSPVYSKVVRVNAGKSVYVSGLCAAGATDAAGQIRAIFSSLKEILEKSGSDLKHLAKATYYVTDDETAKKLGEIRPEFYDPKSPPAASRSTVAGVGREGGRLTLDMIAVPAR